MTAHRQLLFAVVFGGVGVGLALAAARRTPPPAGAATPPDPLRPEARLETPAANDGWPARKLWVWAVEPFGMKRKTGVRVRTVRQPLARGELQPARGTNASPCPVPAAGEAVYSSGWSLTGGRPVAGRVVVQFIDLHDLGLGEPKDGKPLRLRVAVETTGRHDGLTISGSNAPAGPGLPLPGTEYAGCGVDGGPAWAGDLLPLLVLHTRSADTFFTHHVYVEQTDAD